MVRVSSRAKNRSKKSRRDSSTGASARRQPPRGRGFAIALVVIIVLTAAASFTGPAGGARDGQYVRYEAESFSVKVPSSFMERVGAKAIEGGVERRSYNGLGDISKQPIQIQVMTSGRVKGSVEDLARGLAQNVAEQTKGGFEELEMRDSDLQVDGAREIRFRFMSNTDMESRGVLAYGRTSGKDISVMFLYPAADADAVEDGLLGKVLRSVKLD